MIPNPQTDPQAFAKWAEERQAAYEQQRREWRLSKGLPNEVVDRGRTGER